MCRMEIMLKKRSLWLLSVMVSIAVTALIIYFSSQPSVESHELSNGLAACILAQLREIFPNVTLNGLDFFLRKMAHFSLYFVLGCSLTGVFSRQGKLPPVLLAIFAGACFAASDELHQMFSDGRSASIRDVMLDTCGVAVGSLLSYGTMKLLRKQKKE